MFGFSKLQLGISLVLLAIVAAFGVSVLVLDARLTAATAQKAALQAEYAVLEGINLRNAEALQRLQIANAKANAVATLNAEQSRAAQDELDDLKREISRVPDPTPGVPACRLPALQLVLDRLRGPPVPGDRDPARAPERAGHALPVQERPRGPGQGR